MALLFGLLWMVLLPPPAVADELVLDDGRVWRFAETLLKDGEYYRAISEYRRLTHFFPDSPHATAARLRIGEALLRGGEAAQAIAHFDSLETEPALAPHRDELLYLRGLSRLELDRGRPYPLREANIAAGLADLHAIAPSWPDRPRVRGFVEAMRHPPELPQKSPVFAGTLSAVLPGTGSFYVGRPAEGSLALFVNAVLIYATVNAFEEDKEGLGIVLGGFAVAFYGGAILAAVNGAHKFNDGAKAGYLARQRTRYGIVIERGALGAAFERRF
jgi:hypothetical protein